MRGCGERTGPGQASLHAPFYTSPQWNRTATSQTTPRSTTLRPSALPGTPARLAPPCCGGGARTAGLGGTAGRRKGAPNVTGSHRRDEEGRMTGRLERMSRRYPRWRERPPHPAAAPAPARAPAALQPACPPSRPTREGKGRGRADASGRRTRLTASLQQHRPLRHLERTAGKACAWAGRDRSAALSRPGAAPYSLAVLRVPRLHGEGSGPLFLPPPQGPAGYGDPPGQARAGGAVYTEAPRGVSGL